VLPHNLALPLPLSRSLLSSCSPFSKWVLDNDVSRFLYLLEAAWGIVIQSTADKQIEMLGAENKMYLTMLKYNTI